MWLNHAVSKKLVIKVLTVISLLGPKSGSFCGRKLPECIFSSFAFRKDTSLSQEASFEPSTINTGSGVRPVDVRKKKRDG